MDDTDDADHASGGYAYGVFAPISILKISGI